MTDVALGPGGGEADLPPDGPHPFRPDTVTGPGTWSLSWHGVRTVASLELLALTLLMVCAIGLGYSALTARSSASAVLTYLTVTFLGLGLPLLFALSFTLVTTRQAVPIRQPVNLSVDNDTTTSRCELRPEVISQTHTERIWWLLAPSPYVVVADAAPTPTGKTDDPLSIIRGGVRQARLGPPKTEDWCGEALIGTGTGAGPDRTGPDRPGSYSVLSASNSASATVSASTSSRR